MKAAAFLIAFLAAVLSCRPSTPLTDTWSADAVDIFESSQDAKDIPDDFLEMPDPAPEVETVDDTPYVTDIQDEVNEINEISETKGWRKLPLGVTADIFRVKGDSKGDIFAVGKEGLTLRYRGEFVPVKSGVKVNLYGAAVSGSLILACGEKGTIIRNSSGGFEKMESAVDVDLKDIAIFDSNTYYAVGEKGTILKWNGSKWEKELSGVEYHLNAVVASDKWGIFAVGNNGMLLEKKGGVWLMSNIANPSSHLNDIWVAENGEMFAVGTLGTIVRYDGFSWKQQLSNDPKERDLYSVFGFSENEVYAVGSEGAVIKYNGKKWNIVSVEGPYNTYADFRGIWGYRDLTGTLLLAGGLEGKFLRFAGDSWKDFSASVQSDINSIYSDQESTIFVGDNGLILRYDFEFNHIESNTTKDLNAVFGNIIVGNNGKMLKVEGNTVAEINSNALEDIKSVWVSQTDKIYAVGETGLFLMGDLSFLSQLEGAPLVNLNAVFGLNDSAVFAAGDKGTLLFYDGKKINKMPSPSSAALHDIFGTSLNNLYAVGDFGVVLKFSGSVWEKILDASETFLYGVGGSQRIFAAGWAGSFYELKGGEAVKIETPYKYIFEDLTYSPLSDSYLLCGRKGIAVEYKQ